MDLPSKFNIFVDAFLWWGLLFLTEIDLISFSITLTLLWVNLECSPARRSIQDSAYWSNAACNLIDIFVYKMTDIPHYFANANNMELCTANRHMFDLLKTLRVICIDFFSFVAVVSAFACPRRSAPVNRKHLQDMHMFVRSGIVRCMYKVRRQQFSVVGLQRVQRACMHNIEWLKMSLSMLSGMCARLSRDSGNIWRYTADTCTHIAHTHATSRTIINVHHIVLYLLCMYLPRTWEIVW